MAVLLKSLGLIAVIIVLGNTLLEDVGYVLMRYRGWAVETSLLVYLLGMLILFGCCFMLARRLPKRKKLRGSDTTITNTPVSELIQQGDDFFQQQQFAKAAEFYKKALQLKK